MEFMNRDGRGSQPTGTSSHTTSATGVPGRKKRGFKLGSVNTLFGALLFSGTILIAAVLLYMFLGGARFEASHVDKDRFQAVFLNGGQVYFGKIQDLNDKYVRLDDIYYLRVTQQVQPGEDQSAAASNPELVKLGCELHGPQDEMVINREQVLFWENLKSEGKVADAVKRYREQYPNGRTCEDQAQDDTSGTNNP